MLHHSIIILSVLCLNSFCGFAQTETEDTLGSLSLFKKENIIQIKRVDIIEIDSSGVTHYLDMSRRPLDGDYIILEANGHRLASLRQGLLDGEVLYVGFDGNMKEKLFYRNGVPHGFQYMFISNYETRSSVMVVPYWNGKTNGVCFKNDICGEYTEHLYYIDDKLIKSKAQFDKLFKKHSCNTAGF